jgi:ribosomal protein S12 methylthiotransferase accessory factor
MKDNSLLLIRASSIISHRKTVFHALTKKVYVEAPSSLMREVIGLCDGTKTYLEILNFLGVSWNRETTKQLIQELCQQGIIINAHSLVGEIWEAIENPMQFPPNLSEEDISHLVEKAKERQRLISANQWYSPSENFLEGLLLKRHSVRSFSGEAISFQAVVDLLWSAYGECKDQENGGSHRVVPSAGALYPLVIHVALLRKTGGLKPSIYRVCYNRLGKVGFRRVSSDVDRFARAFLNPAGIQDGMHGVIVLSGNFSITGEKYGNRSMLYVILEAGHAAQNIILQGVKEGIATLEIGGFIDTLLTKAIDLEKEYRPLTTVAFGKEGSKEKNFPSSLQIHWAVPIINGYHLPFAIASAKVYEKRSWSHGRDPSPTMALTKAIAEAKEWTAASSVPKLVIASFDELDSVIDPRTVVKFHPAQYRVKDFPFRKFDEQKEYAWTRGIDYFSGNRVYILADHVYFPYFPKTPYYCFSNSSGCAAHPDEQTAIKTATLELIERDAFMIAYLSKLIFPTIIEKTLPRNIQQRIADLRLIGFKIWIKDHSLDLAPVVTVFAQSRDMAFSTCASSSGFDLEYIVNHALMEVEASLLARFQNGQPVDIAPREVSMPLDHGRLYGQRRYYHSADFLVRDGDIAAFKKTGSKTAHSWQELTNRFLQRRLNLFIVPLHLSERFGGNTNLHILRAIVPGLVPMTFGYRQEPAGMERIYTIAKEFGDKKLSYRELTKFPHPFE